MHAVEHRQRIPERCESSAQADPAIAPLLVNNNGGLCNAITKVVRISQNLQVKSEFLY